MFHCKANVPAPNAFMVTTTARHMITHNAGLTDLFLHVSLRDVSADRTEEMYQKPITTDAALSSVGRRIDQLYPSSPCYNCPSKRTIIPLTI